MTFILLLLITIAFIGSFIFNLKLIREKRELQAKKSDYKQKAQRLDWELKQCKSKLQKLESSKINSKATPETAPNSRTTVNLKGETRAEFPNKLEEETVEQKALPNEISWQGEQLKAKPQTKKELFFKGPIADNKFLKNDAAEEQRARFVYRVELEGSNSGILHLDPKSATDLDLIRNFPESILENACVYENAFKVDFKNLYQVSPGTVVSDGANWKVTKKIKIRFD